MILLLGTCFAATTFDAERFHPAVSGDLLGVPTAFADGAPGLGGRYLAGVSVGSVVFEDVTGSRTALVGTRFGGELGARYQRGRLAGAISLPASRVDGDLAPPAFVLGDLRVEALGRIYAAGPAAVGAVAALRLPTGDADRWSGAGQVSGSGGLVLSARGGPVTGGVTFGVDSGSPYETPTFRWGPQLTWSGGVAIGLPLKLRAVAELDGGLLLREGGGADPGEWRLGLGYRATPTLDALVAAGRGYTAGVGNPTVRVLASLIVHPTRPLIGRDQGAIRTLAPSELRLPRARLPPASP